MSLNTEATRKVPLYIPRLLGNVKQQQLNSTFHELDIGQVFYVDMHNRVNENNNKYYFAFVSISLYDSKRASEFYQRLLHTGRTRIVYNEKKNQYWEVKLHVEKGLRTNLILPSVKDNEKEYIKGLEEEYDELAKEIFYITSQL